MVNVNEPVDPKVTIPATQPTIPAIADKLSPKVRSWVYALIGPAIQVWLMIRAGVDPETIVLAVLGTAGFGVAFANVPRRM